MRGFPSTSSAPPQSYSKGGGRSRFRTSAPPHFPLQLWWCQQTTHEILRSSFGGGFFGSLYWIEVFLCERAQKNGNFAASISDTCRIVLVLLSLKFQEIRLSIFSPNARYLGDYFSRKTRSRSSHMLFKGASGCKKRCLMR